MSKSSKTTTAEGACGRFYAAGRKLATLSNSAGKELASQEQHETSWQLPDQPVSDHDPRSVFEAARRL
jgi:hypothetical protein